MSDLIAKLAHFEQNRIQRGDKLGAEVLHHAQQRIAELESRIRERDKDIAELVALREREAFYEGMRKDMSNKQQRIAELEALIEADGKEIGSYGKGTGLRGEWRELQVENDRLRGALKQILTCRAPHLDRVFEITKQALEAGDG